MHNGMLIAFTATLLVLAGCAKTEQSLDPEKKNEPVRPDSSGARPGSWVQSEFTLSTFFAIPGSGDTAIYRKIFSLTKESGINLVELAFLPRAVLKPALDMAELTGVRILAQDLASFSGFQTSVPVFTEETIINNVSWMDHYRMLEGYYVWDEPFLTTMIQAKTLCDHFKAHDPGRLAFSVMLPSYGPYTWSDSSYPRYVDDYISTIDPEVISFDYYPFRDNNASVTLTNNDLWKDFGYIRKKALQYNKPLWFYFQAVGMQPPQPSIVDLERIRVQMYAALAYGVKGLSYYYSHEVLIDPTTYEKTAMFNDLKDLNTTVKNIGNFLFDKRSEKIYQTGIPSANEGKFYLDSLSSSGLLLSPRPDWC